MVKKLFCNKVYIYQNCCIVGLCTVVVSCFAQDVRVINSYICLLICVAEKLTAKREMQSHSHMHESDLQAPDRVYVHCPPAPPDRVP
jgi:hypothetical protein